MENRHFQLIYLMTVISRLQTYLKKRHCCARRGTEDRHPKVGEIQRKKKLTTNIMDMTSLTHSRTFGHCEKNENYPAIVMYTYCLWQEGAT